MKNNIIEDLDDTYPAETKEPAIASQIEPTLTVTPTIEPVAFRPERIKIIMVKSNRKEMILQWNKAFEEYKFNFSLDAEEFHEDPLPIAMSKLSQYGYLCDKIVIHEAKQDYCVYMFTYMRHTQRKYISYLDNNEEWQIVPTIEVNDGIQSASTQKIIMTAYRYVIVR